MKTMHWAIAMLSASACGGTEEVHGTDHRSLRLAFQASVAGAPVDCRRAYPDLGTGATTASVADARLYISAIELESEVGEWMPLRLDTDSPWQYEDIALLDFEDGEGACADSGNADLNASVRGDVPAGISFRRLRFQIGVPFALNHNDSATAPAPLNVPAMYWTWQGGYKFLRLDWALAGGARWNIHLGATGCASAAKTEAPTEPCARSNRPHIVTETFELTPDADTLTVHLDFARLVAGSDLELNSPDTPPGCQSSPAEPEDCGPVFAELGLDFDEGACVDDCAQQSLVSLDAP